MRIFIAYSKEKQNNILAACYALHYFNLSHLKIYEIDTYHMTQIPSRSISLPLLIFKHLPSKYIDTCQLTHGPVTTAKFALLQRMKQAIERPLNQRAVSNGCHLTDLKLGHVINLTTTD